VQVVGSLSASMTATNQPRLSHPQANKADKVVSNSSSLTHLRLRAPLQPIRP
jgi:hypothetical protein